MQSLNNFQYVFSIEEHGIIGGFGSSIDEILNDIRNPLVTFKKIGLDNEIHKDIGSQDYLRKIKNIDATGITKFVLNNIK